MTYLELFTLLNTAQLSPEEFGKQAGISGMTLRRWMKHPDTDKIPVLYETAIREVCFKLIAQGRINAEMPSVRRVIESQESAQYDAALKTLGVDFKFPLQENGQDTQVLDGLTQIGKDIQKQKCVVDGERHIFSFKKLSADWSSHISNLWGVIQSNKIAPAEKVIAFGSLFYLLTPLDFIPDYIPVIGLIDDFSMLGIAVAYYGKLFKDGSDDHS